MNKTDTYLELRGDYLLKNFTDHMNPHIPVIDDAIRTVGVFPRYFGHYISRPSNIYEISGDTYTKFAKNPFYVVVKVLWYVKGPKHTEIKNVREQSVSITGVEEANKESVKEVLLTMPGLTSYIGDYLQFWQGE